MALGAAIIAASLIHQYFRLIPSIVAGFFAGCVVLGVFFASDLGMKVDSSAHFSPVAGSRLAVDVRKMSHGEIVTRSWLDSNSGKIPIPTIDVPAEVVHREVALIVKNTSSGKLTNVTVHIKGTITILGKEEVMETTDTISSMNPQDETHIWLLRQAEDDPENRISYNVPKSSYYDLAPNISSFGVFVLTVTAAESLPVTMSVEVWNDHGNLDYKENR
jgi:hypothetical protein